MDQDVTAVPVQAAAASPQRSSWAGCPRSAAGEAGLDVSQLPCCKHRAGGRWEPSPAAAAAF